MARNSLVSGAIGSQLGSQGSSLATLMFETLLWLIALGLFGVYTANFASYSKTYRSLASIVVVLLWLYLSAVAVLIGAEIDGLRTASPAHAT
jgi:YihY family inner membrane protein